MKWEKKGHEFDEQGKMLSEEFAKRREIFIFGAGLIGVELQRFLEKYECFAGYIDNDIKKQKLGMHGKKVLSLQEYLNQEHNEWVVIAADKKNIPTIVSQMEEKGLVLNKDFYIYTEFIKNIFPILSVYYFNKVYINLTQISLTERCTLRCEKCAHACNLVSRDSKDMELEEAFYSADTFFKVVDYVREFVLIGGEPLLYKDLAQVVKYIGKKYRSKMDIFSITTNGTLRPDEELLRVCKEYNVLFRISNYSKQNPHLRQKYIQIDQVLKEEGIFHIISDENLLWMDYGFDSLNREASEEILIDVFDKCKTPCSEIRGDRYYFCVMARTVSENMKKNVGQEDYLDMKALYGIEGKRLLLEYSMGYSEKGYLDMCNFCHGSEAEKYPVPAAKQMKAYME